MEPTNPSALQECKALRARAGDTSARGILTIDKFIAQTQHLPERPERPRNSRVARREGVGREEVGARARRVAQALQGVGPLQEGLRVRRPEP